MASLIATCEAKLGRAAAAERHAAEAVAIAPANREALVRSAQVHARLRQPDAALKDSRVRDFLPRIRLPSRRADEGSSPRSRDLPAFQSLVEGVGAPGRHNAACAAGEPNEVNHGVLITIDAGNVISRDPVVRVGRTNVSLFSILNNDPNVMYSRRIEPNEIVRAEDARARPPADLSAAQTANGNKR